jgi:lysophospholipase L1-like esterase
MQPADKVIALNKMIKDYAQKNHITYVDYHSVLKDEKNGLPKEIAEDGIHPTN